MEKKVDKKRSQIVMSKFGRYLALVILVPMLMAFVGCKGEFTGGTLVTGLSFETQSRSGVTDKDGTFCYRPKETIQFSIGDLVLGAGPAVSVGGSSRRGLSGAAGRALSGGTDQRGANPRLR